MKISIIACLLLLPVVVSAVTNDFQQLLIQLSGVNAVEGSAVGSHATPGKFYTLSLAFLRCGTQTDYRQMLTSTNATTRLMGVYCIVNTNTNAPESCLPISMFVDKNKVGFAPGGCGLMLRTVADIVKEFIRDPGCLAPSRNKK